MRVPLLDINRQVQPIRAEIDKAISDVIDQTSFVLGPEVKALEDEIANYCGSSEAIGVASGTDALIIAMKALGIDDGDEVITTPYSFFATASAIWRLGARPVFVDIDPGTYNLDPGKIKAAITERTKAILVVHLFGQTPDMDAVKNAAGDIFIVEDAAQAIGASWKEKRAGNLGDVGCFSFFPSKNLGGFGDGGMITTSDQAIADRCRAIRVHGALKTYIHEEVGLNSRLDTLQAAVLRVKLPYLDSWSGQRRLNADYYNKMFADSPIVTPVSLPSAKPIYNQYVVRVPKRDLLRKKLAEKGIGHSVYYPLPLHLQPCFKELNYKDGDFPEAEKAAKESIALPIFSELERQELQVVADAVLQHIQDVS